MSYRTFTVEKNPLEVLGALWNHYGMKRAQIKEERNETISIYQKGIVGGAEVHAHAPTDKSPSKIMLIGEVEDINHTKINLEIVIRAKLQPAL